MPQPGPSPSATLADLAFGRCVLRPAARQLLVDGLPVSVGARAFDLLLALVERRERVVTKDELLDLVWPGVVVEENNLQVHVAALRKRLGPAAIATVNGRGYRFAAEVQAALPGGGATRPDRPAPSLTALFGREHDLQTLHYLSLAHRLVNIVGAGGIGKTALARAVAAQQAGRYTYGTCFVDLALLGHAHELPPCLEAALQPWLAACRASADPAPAFSLLLVLDNCEHLVHAAAEWAAAALARWPGLHLLATSQELLHLPGEQVYRVTTLALPPGPGLAAAQAASAVRLFEARAQAADRGFVLDESNAALVVAICQKLDGVALAIELAAARVPYLGLQGLHDRLHQRLRVLGTPARDLPSRQRTLAAALDWSHALLSPAEQAVLRRLAVMSGSFSPACAQAVAGGEGIDAWQVLDHLGSLVDKSLLSVADSGPDEPPRLRLLETVRQFALERLAHAGEEAASRNRHLAHLLDLAEQARDALTGPAEGRWLSRLHRDHDNLLAALAWCEHAPQGAARGLRLVSALHRYWLNRGSLAQGRHACTIALARPEAAAQGVLYGQALWVAGRISACLGHDAEALAWLQRSAEVADACQDRALRVQALTWLGAACAQQGERAAARRHRQDALAAARLAPEAPDLLIQAANGLAELERLEGRLDAAQPLYEEALRRARAVGNRLSTLALLANLCMLQLGCEPAALPLLAQRLLEALSIAEELDSARGRLTVLEVCAGLAAAQGEWDLALRWDAAATQHLAAMGRQRDPTDLASLGPVLDRARAALGDAAAAARAAGAQLPLALALDEARDALRRALPVTIDR